MNMIKYIIISLFLLVGIPLKSQDNIIPSKSLMPVGVYYYPEHWDKNQWEMDIKRIADEGFEFTHFGEFAWAKMEPEEGKFTFGWLDTCVQLAGKHGLKVIMCTPTPTPPAWLTVNYPEVLAVDEHGTKMRHGGRLHANGMNEKYQFFAKRIVRKLAARYGQNSIVCGWQIDNEPHFKNLYDYSETAQKHFRKWLKNKYTTVENLNESWGTAFWSQLYNNFEQIRIPNKLENAGGNPTAFLDFKRFTADELASYIRYQAEILHSSVSDNQWITTNYAYYKFLPSVDLFRNRGDLDFASHTMYLLSTFLNYPDGDLAHRLGSGLELSFSNELARSVEGKTGIMELQPGQINWGKWNSRPLPGAVRMWLWHSFGLGDEFVCTYRFRQPLYGSEQFHEGILETDGLTLSHGGKEYISTIREIQNISVNHNIPKQEPLEWTSRKTAFLWKQSNIFDMENLPHTNNWDTWQHYYTYYDALKRMGCQVSMIREQDRFDPDNYPFMIAPAYSLVNKALIKKWSEYVENGGHLVLSCRTGMKDNNGHLHEAMLQEPIWELTGAKVDFYDHLPPGKYGEIIMDGKEYRWNVWADILIPDKKTEVLAKHTDQFYSGSPVVVSRKAGKGSVTYIGVWTGKGLLEYEILKQVYLSAGAEILDLPSYVFTEYRDGCWLTVNYTSNTVEAPVHKGATIVIGKKKLEPAGVCIWKK